MSFTQLVLLVPKAGYTMGKPNWTPPEASGAPFQHQALNYEH
jgi:hypothetical protein